MHITGPEVSLKLHPLRKELYLNSLCFLSHNAVRQDGEPVRPGVAMTDLATGLFAHGAVMAALLQRHKTGTGSHIDCNLLSSQVPPGLDQD